MSITDSVVVAIAISLSAAPQTESISTPTIAAYHNLYPQRFKLYSAAGGAGLTAMITDGFKVTDAAYKAASAICSQQPCPANFAIGRRALAPFQTLTLTCTDGTIGDSYNFTLVGGASGASHAISYTIPPNFGTAVTGTVALTASTAITFSGTQTMAAGDLLVFSAQPGVYYALSAAIVASTAGVLTTAYAGPVNPTATATHLATLAGTFNAVNGATNIPTTTSQVGAVAPGDSVMFASQLGVYYTVAAGGVAAGALTLTTPYTGVTAATAQASDVASVASAAAAVGALVTALTDLGTVAVAGNVITISRTDGKLNDVQGWRANSFANLQVSDTTADPGIASDLAAIFKADSLDWYSLVLDSNSAAEIKAAAAWAEATGEGGKVLFANTSDWGNGQSTVTSDLFSAVQVLGYKKTHVQQNNSQLLSYAGAATAAWTGSQNPGSYALAQGMALAGVPCDTEATLPESEALVINARTASSPTTLGKGGNFYKVTAGVNASFWGYTPAGGFMDNTIFVDWLQSRIQADVFAVMAGLPKVPFTQMGAGLLGDAIDTRLQIGASALYGGIDGTQPITVNVPNVLLVDATDRAARNLPGWAFQAYLSSAVESTIVQGTLVA